MKYLISNFAPDTYAVAIKDNATWDVPTYTNFYVLIRKERIILIDAGLKAYKPAVIKALAEIGVSPGSVTDLLLTHGHHDHVEGASVFTGAKKFVHNADLNLLNPVLVAQFISYVKAENGDLLVAEDLRELEIIHVNSHTAGSVVIYDKVSKGMFVGDFFCFFGEALPAGVLVTYSAESRQGSYQYVADQAAVGGSDFTSFMRGLERLLPYEPEFFCTGHGVILIGEIKQFIEELWKSGNT